MPKTLVTGAGGFIGSHVVRELLNRNRSVLAVLAPGESRQNLEGLDVEIVECDVRDADAVNRMFAADVNVVYHLAAIYAIWLPRRELMYEVNCMGSMNVLWAAYKKGVDKVVYTSSIAAVGHRDDGRPADETTAFNHLGRHNDYVLTKWMSEEEAKTFARNGLPIVFCNPAGPIGPRDKGPTPTGEIILNIVNGKMRFHMGTGFGMVDVEDVALGHILAEEKGRIGERYLLCSENLNTKDLVELVLDVCGVKARIPQIPAAPFIPLGDLMEAWADRTGKKPMLTGDSIRYANHDVFFDHSKAERELGLTFRPVRESVERAVRWFAANGMVTDKKIARRFGG